MNHRDIIAGLLAWFRKSARDLPWRRTRDPYAIWVSEIMLQQTQVKTVLPYWERWMKALPTISALAKASPKTIHKLWEGLGYYTRVRNLREAAQIIIAKHDRKFPEKFEEMLALPGIGPYTAGAIASIVFNQPRPVLDGNAVRVLTRLFGIAGNPKAKPTNARLWRIAGALVIEAAKSLGQLRRHRSCSRLPVGCSSEDENGPDHASRITHHASHFNQALMELGALICTPRQPQCRLCPIAAHCLAFRQGRVHELPNLARRAPPLQRRFVAFVLENRGRFLARQRPAGVVNAHLWEFPNTESSSVFTGAALQQAARNVLDVTPAILEPLCTIKHSITRYRITLEVFRVEARHESKLPIGSGIPRREPRGNVVATAEEAKKIANALPRGRWLRPAQLNQLPFASAHKKILQKLGSQEALNACGSRVESLR